MTKPQLSGTGQAPVFEARSEFYSTLVERANQRLEGVDRRGAARAHRKAALLLAAYVTNLAAIVLAPYPAVQLLLFIPWGVVHAAVGFNIFHDSIHGSFARSERGNRWLAFVSCALLGVSRYFWYHKHNVLHHRYPNVQGWDDDLETRGGLRLSPAQDWSLRYRFQHLYAPLVYSLTTLEWIFVKDFVQYFTRRMNRCMSIPAMTAADHLEFWATKTAYFAITIGIPLGVMPPEYFFAGYIVLHLTLSLTLASIFQLAHVTAQCVFPEPCPDSSWMESDWAVHQMKTTANFSTGNAWLTWFSGGLNFQVEHHLFPLVSHVHYPVINEILTATALEFNITYHSYPTYRGALAGHLQVLKRLSMPA
jgi:linoleoyl-CoA desaturase